MFAMCTEIYNGCKGIVVMKLDNQGRLAFDIYLILVITLFVFAIMYAMQIFMFIESKCCCNKSDKNEKREKKNEELDLFKCLIAIIYMALKAVHICLAACAVLIDIFTLQECCWCCGFSYTLRNIITFVVTMAFYFCLLANNAIILNAFIDFNIKNQTILNCTNLTIVSLVFIILLIIWEVIYFFGFSLYKPEYARDIEKLKCPIKCNNVVSDVEQQKFAPRLVRFMRSIEIDSYFCLLGNFCGSTNLEHILRCHKKLHIPIKKCNPYYCLTCRCNYLVGFHQTDPKFLRSIALNGLRLGRVGMFGSGIYFARSIADTYGKAQNEGGAIIVALVDMGKMKTVYYANRSITQNNLNFEGYDSVYAEAGGDLTRDEFVVYSPDRIKSWIICY